MLSRLFVGVVAVCLFTSPALAEDSKTAGLTTNFSLSAATPRFVLDQEPTAAKPAGFDEWSTRIERAQARSVDGKKWLLTGVVVSGVGALLAGLNKVNESNFGGPNPEHTFWAAMGMIAGAGMAGYGGYRYAQARGNIEELEREGRAKGYLTLSPLPEKGIYLAVHLEF